MEQQRLVCSVMVLSVTLAMPGDRTRIPNSKADSKCFQNVKESEVRCDEMRYEMRRSGNMADGV